MNSPVICQCKKCHLTWFDAYQYEYCEDCATEAAQQLNLFVAQETGAWHTHEWVNIGFRHDKYVCKICGIDKPE